ncbi:hypothetical protein BS17DRAFT_766503 [Gyrodon lividus]|nr:hypothetical protein BS17DRAFT_766503 [Gyrodon lividus]
MTVLNPQIFAGSHLADSDSLSDALGILESCLAGPDTRLDSIVQDLCSVSGLFEFVISVLLANKRPVWPHASLVVRILNAYPSEPALIQSSFTSALLLRLSSVIFALPPDLFSIDTLRDIGRFKVYVEDALPVLYLLCSSHFTNCVAADPNPRAVVVDEPDYDNEVVPKFSGRSKKQKKPRRKNIECGPSIDVAPFHKFGEKVPSSPESVAQMARDIADELKMVLRFYLDLLLEPTLAQPLKYAYLVYPVQPMKTSLWLGNPDGFGKWRILISIDATKKLRELTKSDREQCVSVVKKIKHLSNGHFSEENQKRLNDSSGVPIFEVKMQQDLRLVISIKLMWCSITRAKRKEKDKSSRYTAYTPTHNTIVYGAQWANTLLAKVKNIVAGMMLTRCMHRNPPARPGDDVYLPACFLSKTTQTDTKSIPLLSDKVMDEVPSSCPRNSLTIQSLRSLEKYVTFSKALLQTHRNAGSLNAGLLATSSGEARAWEMQTYGMPKPRQVFVTKCRVLATKVEHYFTKLSESLALAGYSLKELKKMKTEAGSVDVDDISEDQGGIPQRYSALEEKHFPLFVTFDNVILAKMIAGDVLNGDDPEVHRVARFFIDTDVVQAQDSLVTYNVFAHAYWPHFSQLLTKGLGPSLVFSEFMAYCKLKKNRRQYDVADRTHAILKTLLGGTPLRGQQVDYLYVDEAQDNLLIDALLLRLICRNPEGLFWAADTAQTISAGSSFRFDDLKAFLYRIEAGQSVNIVQERVVTQPVLFQLTTNYRSHGGIVNCAQSVIELITRFWPNAIDGLQPEHGVVDGLKPVFFHGWDEDTVRYAQFLFGAFESHIDFDAQQCILVRDEAAKENLRQQVGALGLIMTLHESKGLEFNDVLLYNFFEDSAVDLARWRVVLDAIDDEVQCNGSSNIHGSKFQRDEGRYAGVCNELSDRELTISQLKLLHVGITRARKNLWIVDKSTRCELMRNCTPGQDVPHPSSSVSSTPEEWAALGHSLFKHKRYPQAMRCFERTSLPREVAVTKAYHLRELARASVGVTSSGKQQEAFRTAATAFWVCGVNTLTRERHHYYRNAADCYIHAGNDHLAAKAYFHAEEYELAAKRYRDSKKIAGSSANDVCRHSKEKGRVMPLESLFKSFEEEELDILDVARVDLLESHGRFVEAAELYFSEGRPLDAIKLFLKESLASLVFWRHCSFGVSVKDALQDDTTSQLFAMIKEIPLEKLAPQNRDQILMFQVVAEQDDENLEKLATSFQEKGDTTATLWTLDHLLSRLPRLLSVTLQELTIFLQRFYTYARLLSLTVSHNDPIGDHNIRKLMGVTEISKDEFSIHPGAFLSHQPASANNNVHRLPPSFSRQALTGLLKERMRYRLQVKVDAENKYSREARVFSQCLAFVMNDCCSSVGCPQEHTPMKSLDQAQYNARVEIHLQQMRILQLMYSAHPRMRQSCNVKSNIADWLNRLYEAVFPPVCYQGSIADINWSTIQDGSDGIRIMKEWVRTTIYSLHPNNDPQVYITSILRLTKLSLVFDELDPVQYIAQAANASAETYRHQELLRGVEKANIVEDTCFYTRPFANEHLI